MTINDHTVISDCYASTMEAILSRLEPLKVYPVLADERAAFNNFLRIIDETGEDYLYPAKYFVPGNAIYGILAARLG